MLEIIHLKCCLARSRTRGGNELISGREAEGRGNVVASERLGGLLKYYRREAARNEWTSIVFLDNTR